MGRDKALVEVNGLPMVLHVAAALRAAGCEPVLAVGGDRPALEALGLQVVDDDHPGDGPLGGVITALATVEPDIDAVMVAACDLPLLTARTVGELMVALDGADVAVAGTDRAHPVCAIWRRSVLSPLREVFETGERRLSAALTALDTVEVPVNPQDLANVNTPGDLPQ